MTVVLEGVSEIGNIEVGLKVGNLSVEFVPTTQNTKKQP